MPPQALAQHQCRHGLHGDLSALPGELRTAPENPVDVIGPGEDLPDPGARFVALVGRWQKLADKAAALPRNSLSLCNSAT